MQRARFLRPQPFRRTPPSSSSAATTIAPRCPASRLVRSLGRALARVNARMRRGSTCATAAARRRRSISSCPPGGRAARWCSSTAATGARWTSRTTASSPRRSPAQESPWPTLNYDLCPAVSIAGIVAQATRAVAFLQREGTRLGLAPGPLVVAGHSAGGHLAAMIHATAADAFGEAAHPVRERSRCPACTISRRCCCRRTTPTCASTTPPAHAVSPVHRSRNDGAPAARGRRGRDFRVPAPDGPPVGRVAAAVRPAGMDGPLRVPGRHHFDVVFDYADPSSALTRATLDLF